LWRKRIKFLIANSSVAIILSEMSIEQLESQLMAMPAEDRRQFANWFYTHEHEIVEIETGSDISRATQEEILRRRDELRVKPGMAIPVTDEWFSELKQKLARARASQASAR
jgi:hypothetical protein